MYRPVKNTIVLNEELNPDHYFEHIIREVREKNLLEMRAMANIQGGLQALITDQAYKYTSGDSSSIKAETAEQLLRSIYYCIGTCLKRAKDAEDILEQLKSKTVRTLFLEGTGYIQDSVKEAKELFLEVKRTLLLVHNYAYQDTVRNGLDMFFVRYDYRFAAHETPCSIDYPLAKDIMHLSGAAYMCRYLECLNTEGRFCSCFRGEEIEEALGGYSRHYMEDLINIYEIVLGNALARILCGNDLAGLNVTEEDRRFLEELLGNDTVEELHVRLSAAFEDICNSGMIVPELGEAEKEYLSTPLRSLAVRVKQNLGNGNLDKIFVTAGLRKKEEEDISYQAGIQMSDEALRTIIDEIKECRFISDKIAIVRREVKSLNDLTEILEECFWGEEYQEVFKLLSDHEVSVLLDTVREEMGHDNLDSFDPGSWQSAFIGYAGESGREHAGK